MRQMVMARKGGSAPDTGADNNENGGDRGADAHTDSEGAEVTCPECGCQFDPEMAEGGATDGDEESPKGVALEIPAPTPDAQAPIGTDAITKALAAVLGH